MEDNRTFRTYVPEGTVNFGIDPDMPYAVEEALNRLRVNIRFLGSDIRKIMITSADENEGKSFVAMNIWRQMATAGEKCVLLDADMRKSNMVKVYKMRREDGLEIKGTSQFLSDSSTDIREIILHTDKPYGDIIPNAENRINPSMLLESMRYEAMIDWLGKNYRYVFIDSPPLGVVSDAVRIGSLCDGAILAVRSNQTSRSAVRNAIKQLERAGCPLLGIVLNRVVANKGGYYGKYGYGYGYGYYSK